MSELLILTIWLLILGVGGLVADYVFPRIPFIERFIESLPAFEDDEEGGGTVALCKFCGQYIDWIYCPAKGKNVPVDEEPVLVDLSGGEVEFITDEGGTIHGRLARQDAISPDVDVAFLPHRCCSSW